MGNNVFQVSQGIEVIKPNFGSAYVVLCDEWNDIKQKIKNLAFENEHFKDAGFLFFGGTLSAFISIITGAINSQFISIAWVLVGATLILGVAFLCFSKKLSRIEKIKSMEIVGQMELIEKRYAQKPLGFKMAYGRKIDESGVISAEVESTMHKT